MELRTPVAVRSARGCPIVVVDASPAYRLGLSHALRDGGLPVADLDDPASGDVPCGWVALATEGESVPRGDDVILAREPLMRVTLLLDPSPERYAIALEDGALGVVPRDGDLAEILAVVRAAMANRVLLPPSVARWLATRRRHRRADGVVSAQEAQWLQALATGQTVAELARSADYSERELYRRLRAVYSRLGAVSRAEALVRATYLGIVDSSVGPPSVRPRSALDG